MEQTILDDVHKSTDSYNYATFWQRFFAVIIDGILLVIVQLMLNAMMSQMLAGVIYLVIGVLYFCIMESSSYQGTFGKMALQIKVVTLNNETLSFGQALGRYFMRFVSAIILGIGYFMMLWDDKKQCLHDKAIGSIVLKK